ncbi:MAG TPA: ABC transporter ATP-binding protein [Solirubrobacteraceae bacterium]
MAVLTTSGLTKRFETTCAVDRVDLVLGEGEVRGLLGPNGAGKTTLLRMLLGLVRATEGTIELFGHVLDGSNSLALDGVSGFVEEPTFYPYLSGRANLEILAELDGDTARTRIDDVLEQVELTERAEDRVGGYSSGMRQRLGIAATLMRAPRLLLLDEPTSALDPAGARLVVGLVRTLSESGVAVLLSSHQIDDVEEVCDSFSVLSRGRVVWEGTAGRMLAEAPPSAYRIATSDDACALQLAEEQRGIRAERSPISGLTVEADSGALDPFVLALGQADVAVRRLELSMSPLESMFFALTEHSPGDQSVGSVPLQGAPTGP